VSGVIEGTATLDQVMQRYSELPLYVLPQGRPHPAASELMAARATAALLHDLETSFSDSIVVVDSPPLLLTDEPLTLQQMVGACLLVVQQGRTKRDDVQRAAELIDETKYVGSVMNRVRESDLSDGYGYGYR
jgi:receptor protein-tyrosine kinase